MAMQVDPIQDSSERCVKPVPGRKRVFGQELTNIQREWPVPRTDTSNQFSKSFEKRDQNYSWDREQFVAPEPQPCHSRKYSEEEEEFDSLPEWDRQDKDNDIECVQYMTDIMESLREAERNTERERSVDFMKHQPSVNAKMRSLLLEWILEVHRKHDFSDCVLYSTVAILDKYMRREPLSKENLQLFGLTSLWIAAKYHETFEFTVQHLQKLFSRPRDEFIDTERKIVNALKFELPTITPYTFAQRFIKIIRFGLSNREGNFAENFITYLLELALLHYPLSREQPSRIAAAAVTFVLLAADLKHWNSGLERELGYTLQEMKPLMIEYANIIHNDTLYQAVRKKYSKKKFSRVESVVQGIVFVNIEEVVERARKRMLRHQSPSHISG